MTSDTSLGRPVDGDRVVEAPGDDGPLLEVDAVDVSVPDSVADARPELATGTPRTGLATASVGFVRRHRGWLAPLVVYLVIRGIALLTLLRFTDLRHRSLGEVLSAWDGKWMLAIAQHGYGGVPFELADARGVHTADTAYAFFPGYPYLFGAVAKIPFLGALDAALLVNLVLGCVAAVGVARLGVLCARRMSASRSPLLQRARVEPARVGLFAVVIFAAAPISDVLNMAYTEALFCTLAVWALVGIMQRWWIVAGVAACLAGTVRPTAIVVIGVVMLAALFATRRDGWRPWGALVLSPLGYVGYLALVWAHTGSPTGWFRIQTEGWDTRVDFGVASFNFVNDALVNASDVAPIVTAWVMVVTILSVVWAAWARLPWPVWLYGTLVVASIIGSSGLMMSRPRLLLPAFVLFIPLAVLMSRWRLPAALSLVVALVVGSSWFGAHMLTVYPHAI